MTNAISSRFTTIKDFLATQHWPTATDWRQLVSADYWNSSVVSNGSPFFLLTAVVIGLVVIGLIIWLLRLRQLQKSLPIYEKPINQLPTLIIFVAVVSLLYAFFLAQGLQYLSSRLVMLGLFLVTLGWGGFLVVYTLKIIPVKKREYLEKERFFRYLPKKKKNA